MGQQHRGFVVMPDFTLRLHRSDFSIPTKLPIFPPGRFPFVVFGHFVVCPFPSPPRGP
jgi:hypothetical protein